jgi:type I restriction enzyme, S subunit
MTYEQPTKYIVKSTDYENRFATPVLTAGQTFILGYTNEIEGVFKSNTENPVIIFDDFTTSFHWVNFNFKVKSSAMKLLKSKDNSVSFKYIFHQMKTIQYKPQDHARQWISTYSNFSIPIPPLAEQERIVSILDKFDALVNDISIGLPAELKARRQQYEYYRNKLLTFEEYAPEL